MSEKKDDFLTFIVDLQNIEQRAMKLGLYITQRGINAATRAAGWEKTGDLKNAYEKMRERVGP